MRLSGSSRRVRLLALLVALASVAAACSTPIRDRATGPAASLLLDEEVADGTIVVDVDGASLPFPRTLLGTNVPAWIPADRFAHPALHRALRDLGTSVIRMPGGSWSSEYEWLECELGRCHWDWAARPSDFAELLAGTGLEGMWTVSFNGTAEEAAALVAYFNARVGDTRPIGVDRRGRDWGTVGEWAALRAEGGHPEPTPVRYWEIGNEVFAARREAGDGCASFGWELVWTCDGVAYMQGDEVHDGFLRFREAMVAVDPTILVGAVGIGGDQGEWGGFGDEVIDHGGDAVDFYVVHDYGFDRAASTDDVLRRPTDRWIDVIDPVRAALGDVSAAGTPVAVTEYNLYASHDNDTEGMMSEAVTALYVADMIGEMASTGVAFANHWNIANGETAAGSDYGMLEFDTGLPRPSFYAMALWSRFPDALVPVGLGFDRSTEASAYAGRAADGSIALLLVNKTGAPLTATIVLDGVTSPRSATADVAQAASLDDREMVYNGAATRSTDLSASPGASLQAGPQFVYEFAPTSITLLTIAPG